MVVRHDPPKGARFHLRYDAVVRRKLLILIALCCCATTPDQKALAIERGLDAGSQGFDIAVDAAIEVCRTKDLPSEEAREQCVAPMIKANDATTPLIETAVVALQTYWIASAVGDKDTKERALLAVRNAVDKLPDEYFAGLKALARTLR